METNNDDLLESYDDKKSDYDFFQESKENTTNTAYNFVMLGLLLLIGIKFVLSLTDTSPDINTIVIRQVQLLKIVEQADTDEERQIAVTEYDSLARVLDTLKE